MATLNTKMMNLLDLSSTFGKDGVVQTNIAEILAQMNQILEDMPWQEANMVDGHKGNIRTGLPEVYWAILNQGIPSSKSTYAQIKDTCGIIESLSQVDKRLIKLSGNEAQTRWLEAQGHIESIGQTLSENLFYGNAAINSERITGLSVRYSTRNKSTAQSAENVIHAGGAGSDNTSVWLVGWGRNVHGIYPRGSKAGLLQEDKGEQKSYDALGNSFYTKDELFSWGCGLHVADWRYAVRICNIDVSDLAGSTPPNLIDLMDEAIEHLPSTSDCTPVFYANRTVRKYLRQQVRKAVKDGGGLTFENYAGPGGKNRKQMYYSEVPIKRLDRLLNTEALVPNT